MSNAFDICMHIVILQNTQISNALCNTVHIIEIKLQHKCKQVCLIIIIILL